MQSSLDLCDPSLRGCGVYTSLNLGVAESPHPSPLPRGEGTRIKTSPLPKGEGSGVRVIQQRLNSLLPFELGAGGKNFISIRIILIVSKESQITQQPYTHKL